MSANSRTSVVIAGAGPVGLGLVERMRGAAASGPAHARSSALAVEEQR
jgi:threonine dehydrogenase-like Zn-dependent dehydrogenase